MSEQIDAIRAKLENDEDLTVDEAREWLINFAPIWQLHYEHDVPVKAINALIRHGIKTVDDINTLIQTQGLDYHQNIRNYGVVAHGQVMRGLAKQGYVLSFVKQTNS